MLKSQTEFLLSPTRYRNLDVEAGQAVVGTSGAAWITTDEGEDIVLTKGQTHLFKHPAHVLIGSLRGLRATVDLVEYAELAQAA